MDKISRSARLKVKRANSHIDQLIRDSSALPRDLYEITNGPGRSNVLLTQTDGFYLTYKPKQSVTDHFGPIIGDAVNNLREAMDLWINALATSKGIARKLHFPFSAEWKGLETSPNYPPVQKTLPDLANFIREHVKPSRDTNLHLWAATSLCNHNKHNDFVPTVSVLDFQNINAIVGSVQMKNCAIRGDANGPVFMVRAATAIRIQNNFRATVEIKFPQGAIFENEPVIPTLTQMSQVISQTISALDRFVSA